MGGYRGGRDARNLLAEGGLRLRISDLVNGEPIYAGTCRRGSVAWTNSYTRKPSGAVAFRIEAWEETGNMRLRLALVDRATGEPVIREQVIGLTATVQPCGGWRWWFICLRRHDLCSVLHCPPGALAFASRQAWRMAYSSQRVAPQERDLQKAQRIRISLGGSGNMLDAFPDKPKWMRWRTYDGLRVKSARAENASTAASHPVSTNCRRGGAICGVEIEPVPLPRRVFAVARTPRRGTARVRGGVAMLSPPRHPETVTVKIPPTHGPGSGKEAWKALAVIVRDMNESLSAIISTQREVIRELQRSGQGRAGRIIQIPVAIPIWVAWTQSPSPLTM